MSGDDAEPMEAEGTPEEVTLEPVRYMNMLHARITVVHVQHWEAIRDGLKEVEFRSMHQSIDLVPGMCILFSAPAAERRMGKTALLMAIVLEVIRLSCMDASIRFPREAEACCLEKLCTEWGCAAVQCMVWDKAQLRVANEIINLSKGNLGLLRQFIDTTGKARFCHRDDLGKTVMAQLSTGRRVQCTLESLWDMSPKTQRSGRRCVGGSSSTTMCQAWRDSSAAGCGVRKGVLIADAGTLSAVGEMDVAGDQSRGEGQARRKIYVQQSICRRIWISLISQPDPLKKMIAGACPLLPEQSQQIAFGLETSNLTLSDMFSSELVQCVAAADLQWLNRLLADRDADSPAVLLETFRETVLNIFSSVALGCSGVRDLQSFAGKASVLQQKFQEELKRRVNRFCSACGGAGPVFLCSCGEGYCTTCCGDPGTDYVRINCLMCRTDKATGSSSSAALIMQNVRTVGEFLSVRRCLNCQQQATAQCASCSTLFCQLCALGFSEALAERKGWRCVLCTQADLSSHITHIARLVEKKGNCREADQLSEYHMSLLSCGMSTVADGVLPTLCNTVTSQLNTGSVCSITPQQVISSLGTIVSTRLLSRILEGRAIHSRVEAGKVAERTITSRLRKPVRKPGPLRIGYFLSPHLWSIAMLESIAPWLTRFDRSWFEVSVVCLCSSDDPCSLQRLKNILKGISDISWLIIGKELLDEDAYQMVCSAGFDIAVDLDCGGGERRTLKAMRGIAGKVVYAVGLPCPQPKLNETNKICDFVLGDDRALPTELSTAWKKLTPVLKVSLARPFWVSKAKTARRTNTTTREDFQLPHVGFIFIHVDEVSPASSEAIRLLLSVVHDTPGSCLVMCGQTQLARAYLRRETLEFTGDHPSFDPQLRVLYRRWPESTEGRVQLLSHGDLLLATCEGGSNTAAGLLALAACLPVLVRVSASDSEHGQTGFRVQRDICSALWFLGLADELVVRSTDLFLKKARELGNHRSKILQLKQHLLDHEAGENALFSEDRQVREWEKGLQKISKADGANDIDASLPEYPQCEQFKMKRSTHCQALRNPCQGFESELGMALERESILNQMATAHKEFNNPTALAQLDSLLEDAQERGVRLIMQSGSGGFSSVVLGCMAESSKARGVLPGQKLALVFERRKRSVDRMYNGLLFRYAHNVTVNRKRKAFDKSMVQPLRLFENGTSCFSISYPDESGDSICCLVLEGLETGYLDGLQDDIKGWTDYCRLAERFRCDMQHTLYALNTFHDSSIVHRDIKPNNMMRNSKGHIVFIDWGSGWVFAGPGALVQRRATSRMPISPEHSSIKGCSKKTLMALNVGRRVKETIVKRHLPRPRLSRGKCLKAASQTQKRDQQAFSSRLPDERKPSYLSDYTIHCIMRCLAEKHASLATLGNGSELFRRDDLWCESGEELTLGRAVKQDVHALFRTFMMLFRPLGSMSHTQWERDATLAAKSVSSMHKFLLDGGRVALQPRALARLADFLFRGITDLNPKKSQTHEFVTLPIYHEAIEQSIFQGTGYLVKGGEMCSVLGCPFSMHNLKDVLVIREAKIGAGLKAVEAYEEHELITFYFAAERVGLEINEDPPGRYVVAIRPHAQYGNGEFTPELTLEQFAEKKAMGVCINAATNAKSRNCYLMRLHTKPDAANSKYLWIPVRAARRIAAGEYFSFIYNHEAGGGLIRGYNFK